MTIEEFAAIEAIKTELRDRIDFFNKNNRLVEAQRIEQRIGRCHRYGQKHDVVVVNFLNRTNAADQRVFQPGTRDGMVRMIAARCGYEYVDIRRHRRPRPAWPC